MRTFFFVTLVLMVAAFVTFLRTLANAAPLPALGADNQLLSPIQFKQLAVFPVVHRSAAVGAQYLTLTDGVKQKLVLVTEHGQGGTVNRVQVKNNSDKPLLLLGGEIILGGQQDRILGKDTVIPSHESMVVEVFCVEHGRWNGQREFTAGNAIADGKIRVRAKFKSDQQQVWAEVAKKNGDMKVANATGTYRNLATGAEGEKAKKPYRDFLAAEMGKLKDKQVVGLVSAINGRVTSVDVFASPSLFAAYKDKLLDSIVMSAVDVAPAPAAKPATAADVDAFMQNAEVAAPREVLSTKAAKTITKSGKGVLNSTLENDKKEPIYKSYQLDE
jgi:ARG and Rhodanese-Phosphatase-superfamily-associated Protein domain